MWFSVSRRCSIECRRRSRFERSRGRRSARPCTTRPPSPSEHRTTTFFLLLSILPAVAPSATNIVTTKNLFAAISVVQITFAAKQGQKVSRNLDFFLDGSRLNRKLHCHLKLQRTKSYRLTEFRRAKVRRFSLQRRTSHERCSVQRSGSKQPRPRWPAV